jgi:hypothetical protein
MFLKVLDLDYEKKDISCDSTVFFLKINSSPTSKTLRAMEKNLSLRYRTVLTIYPLSS